LPLAEVHLHKQDAQISARKLPHGGQNLLSFFRRDLRFYFFVRGHSFARRFTEDVYFRLIVVLFALVDFTLFGTKRAPRLAREFENHVGANDAFTRAF
jgi:hypothetical protein